MIVSSRNKMIGFNGVNKSFYNLSLKKSLCTILTHHKTSILQVKITYMLIITLILTLIDNKTTFHSYGHILNNQILDRYGWDIS